MRKGYDDAHSSGLHAEIMPPVLSFASELAGLLSDFRRRLSPKSSHVSNTTRESCSRILPNHINEAFSEWGCVTKEKMASALNFSPQATSYWSSRQRDRVFGANHDAFATKYTGFSACPPDYDNDIMYKSVLHAIRSVMVAETPTATFLVLPNWANRSTSPYLSLVHANPEYCTCLGMIPQTKLKYAKPTAWNGSPPTLSTPTWSMNIIVAWNAAGREHLCAKSPDWLTHLRSAICAQAESAWRSSSTNNSTEQPHAPLVLPRKFNGKKDK